MQFNIHEQVYTTYKNVQKDLMGFAVLQRIEGIDQRILTFHPKYQTNFQYEPDEAYAAFHERISAYDTNEEIELMKKLGDPTCSLCNACGF